MDIKNWAGVIVSLVIAVTLFAAILVPVINDSTATEKTFDNRADALSSVSSIDAESDYTFSWTPGESKIEINGHEIEMINNETVICKATDSMVRYTNGYFQYWSNALVTIGGPEQAFTLSISDGIMTIAGDDITTITKDVSGGFILSEKGDYVLKAPTQKAYVTSESDITAVGVSLMTGNINTAISITGTIESLEVSKSYPTNVDFTFSDVAASTSAVSGYEDLYQLDKITFVADDGENTTNCTYNYFIVPAEVTVEMSQHMSDTEITLVNVIPVMVVIGIILGVIGMLYLRRE